MSEQRGSIAVELPPMVLMAIAMIVVVLVAARASSAAYSVEHAAAEAARAAALTQTMGGAQAAATQAAAGTLGDLGLSCTNMGVTVGGDLSPGGSVSATVACTASWSDLTGVVALPGAHQYTATVAEPIDRWRGVDSAAP